MAEFSGKIIEAVFLDIDCSIIKVRYEDGEGKIAIFNLEVDPSNKDYQELISEGWDNERIAEATAEFKRAQSLAFNIEVETAAKKILEEKFGEDFASKDNPDSDGSISWENLLNLNEDKDEIFKFKIWAFESPAMKDATAASKKDLRKAPTLMKAIAIYDTML